MLVTSSPPTVSALYDRDYALWIETTIAQLRSKNVAEIDWENVLEEFEDMGKRERRSLKSNLVILLQYLLKWEFQPEQRSGNWKGSIIEHRQRIRDRFEESPSLRSYLLTVVSSAYANAVERAASETGLVIGMFPIDCPYEFDDILDAAFLPE